MLIKRLVLFSATVLGLFLGSFLVASAATILFPGGGGTGLGFPGGIQANSIPIGNGINPMATSTGLQFSTTDFRLTFTYGSSTSQSSSATSTFSGITIPTNNNIQFIGYSSTPQLYAGDPSTGLHFDGPGIVSIHNSGVQTMLLSSTNKVGIASSSPWKQLSIGSANVGTFAIATSTGGCAQFSSGGELFSTGSNCGTGSGGSDPFTHAQSGMSATTTAIGIGTTTPFSQLSVSTSTASSPLTSLFAVASSTSATLFNVLGSGFVGIGTTSPNQLLTISNTSGTSTQSIEGVASALELIGTQSAGTNRSWAISNNGFAGTNVGTLSISYSSARAGDPLGGTAISALTISNAGNVGIGTGSTAAAFRLSVQIPTGTIAMGSFSKVQTTNDSGTTIELDGGTSGNIPRGYWGFAHQGSGPDTIFSGELANAMALRSENAFQLGTNGNHIAFTVDTSQNLGVGSSTPAQLLSVGNALTNGGLYFNTTGLAIGSSSPQFPWSVTPVLSNLASTFYINSSGELVGYDKTNAWAGRISPTHSFVLTVATTTIWTASTTGSSYTPTLSMPFAGTLKQVRCTATSSQAFLGINPFINTTPTTPSYFVSSTTVGTEKFTGANTFNAGDVIGMNVGTTTSDANAKGVSCTFDIIETP